MHMTRPNSYQKYIKAGISLVILITAGGMLINKLLVNNDPQVLISTTDIKIENTNAIDRHFAEAITYMQKKQYEQAVAEWHQIMLLNPDIPEVQVNMGFALFELGRYQPAREFFISAMERQAFQANAYYGLALVSEKLGDIEGAMGAMRSYIHLVDDDDVFIRKARSALWEWENQLASAKKSDTSQTPASAE